MTQTSLFTPLNTDAEVRQINKTGRAAANAAHLRKLAAAMAPDPSAWTYEGEVSDGKGSNAKCTCGHPIRWIFTIRRKSDGAALPIGSTCIETSVPFLMQHNAEALAEQLTAAVKAHQKALRVAAAAERKRARELAQDAELSALRADLQALQDFRRRAIDSYREHTGRMYVPHELYTRLPTPRPTKTRKGTIRRFVRTYRAGARLLAGFGQLPTPTSPALAD